ncbi:hypothetical protein DFH07DRAFT_764465 [Mycena maculata]|uniref:Uncharacterized protein n=1 Tax=Mycena maculata TaxID=230809 RepID=A0AAD7P042_9AGAR|nr:hypothetical protein DFH07DRAFT_764465 [Mycena maculata]
MNNESPPEASESARERRRTERSRAAHREACAKYRDLNSEALRRKARERMKKYQERNQQTEDTQNILRDRARASSKLYRERHAGVLAMRQHLRRREAFEAKYGRACLAARDLKDQDKINARYQQELEERARREEAEIAARLAEWAAGRVN